MKCAIIGGSTLPRHISLENNQKLDEFASYCANNNIVILTGGCTGYPFLIGKKCIKNNAKVLGYSAAKNEKEHMEVYHHPKDGCSSLFYLDNEEKNSNYRLLIRSLPLIFNSDVVVALEGNWGTLYELITGIICGKKIIIWQGFGGICDAFNSIYNMLSKDCQFNYGEDICYASSMDEIKVILNSMIQN